MIPSTTARRAFGRLPSIVAFVAVLLAYAFYGSDGHGRWHLGDWESSYYANLSRGFLSGHVSLHSEPDPALKALPNPWDFEARKTANAPYLWDTSYLNGKYYLYFTPLPALILYIPVRLMTGRYPSDPFAATLFTTWAFAMWVAFAARAMRIRERKPTIPFPLTILILGVGNMIPFVLDNVRIYEVAITCAMALSATWCFAALRMMENPSRRTAVWMATWLALAIAARPNLGVLVVVAAIGIWMSAGAPRERLRLALAAAFPLAVVGLAYATYNYARFQSPFELGLKYQLSLVSMEGRRVCSLCSWPEASRMLNSALQYTFLPPTIWRTYPFVMMQNNVLDPGLAYPGVVEAVVGIATLNPLTIIGTIAAGVLALVPGRDAAFKAASLILAGGWLVLLALSTCWWIVARYELDFVGLITLGAMIACEAALVVLARAGVRILPLRIALCLIGTYAVLMALTLGVFGPGGAFREANPALYDRMFHFFHHA